MTINEDFKTFLAQRAQELAGQKTAAQTAYERRERLEAEGGELFTGIFAQLGENNQVQEPAPADPAEHDFNKIFGL